MTHSAISDMPSINGEPNISGTSRFSICVNRWYAVEFIGEEFDDGLRSFSPILVHAVSPAGGGKRLMELAFYHANYPEGVRDKCYNLRTIERTERFLLARSTEHTPTRLMLIYEISWDWLRRHFGASQPDDNSDVQRWLTNNT